MVMKYKVGQFPSYHGFVSPLPPRLAIEYFNMKSEIEVLKARIKELEGECSEGEEIMIKDITRDEAKKEIEQLFKSGRTLYYSDLVKELGIDLETVVGICDELQKNKEIAIDASIL